MTSDPPVSGRARFDPVVTTGNLLVVAGIVASAIGVYVTGEVRAAELGYRVAALELSFAAATRQTEKMDDKLDTITETVATIRARLPLNSSANAR